MLSCLGTYKQSLQTSLFPTVFKSSYLTGCPSVRLELKPLFHFSRIFQRTQTTFTAKLFIPLLSQH